MAHFRNNITPLVSLCREVLSWRSQRQWLLIAECNPYIPALLCIEKAHFWAATKLEQNIIPEDASEVLPTPFKISVSLSHFYFSEINQTDLVDRLNFRLNRPTLQVILIHLGMTKVSC